MIAALTSRLYLTVKWECRWKHGVHMKSEYTLRQSPDLELIETFGVNVPRPTMCGEHLALTAQKSFLCSTSWTMSLSFDKFGDGCMYLLRNWDPRADISFTNELITYPRQSFSSCAAGAANTTLLVLCLTIFQEDSDGLEPYRPLGCWLYSIRLLI